MPRPEFTLPPLERVRDDLLKILNRPAPDAALLNLALRNLAKFCSHLVQWELAREYGGRILHGSHVPKLLGCYEHELHPFLEAVVGGGYEDMVNIGCAEGYYAVGLSLRTPQPNWNRRTS